jgi:hypothetical protein
MLIFLFGLCLNEAKCNFLFSLVLQIFRSVTRQKFQVLGSLLLCSALFLTKADASICTQQMVKWSSTADPHKQIKFIYDEAGLIYAVV